MIRKLWKNYYRYIRASNKESLLALFLGIIGAFLETFSIYLLANLITKIENNNFNLDTLNIGSFNLDSLKILANKNQKITVSYEKNKIKIEDIIFQISKQNVKILDITTDDADIEDVYLGLTKS